MASVLITGTSKGIGFETALTFARAGHQVHATMRNPAQSPELAAIAARENLPITVTALDVDSDQSVATAFASIYDSHGPIEVLVNNAGIERVGAIEELSFDDFRATMETNYFGPLRCIKAVVPDMRQRRSGCIINVTSVAGRISCPPFAAYAASKWALEALSEALAAEMKTFNVRVAIVEPGIIDTAMAHRISEPTHHSAYTQRDRMASQFTDALHTPTSPSLVAEKIVEIAGGTSWQLRHLVGPNAAPFIEWRRGMTDEEWVDLHSSNDEEYFRRVAESSVPGRS